VRKHGVRMKRMLEVGEIAHEGQVTTSYSELMDFILFVSMGCIKLVMHFIHFNVLDF
jgi:hypothetical protein